MIIKDVFESFGVMSLESAIVIPTYNEVENIGSLVKSIFEQGSNTKIIVVDDNSRDGTKELLVELSKKFEQKLFVIHRPGKLGIGSAYITGFKYAIEELNCDLVFSMDADLSHNPKYLPLFLEKVDQGFDVVVGSRYALGGGIVGWPLNRIVISKGANWLARTALGLSVSDITTGYRCYKANVLKAIDFERVKSDGYSFLEEILFWVKIGGFKIGETPIIFVDREFGESKLSKREIVKFFVTILRLKFGRR